MSAPPTRKKGKAPGEERFKEALATAITLAFVLAAEAFLFPFERLREDLSDIVTLCAFGGLAAIAAQGQKTLPGESHRWASGILGLVAGLAVFHGTRDNEITSGLLPWTSWSVYHWWPLPSFLVALGIGMLLYWTVETFQASVVQDYKPIREFAILVAFISGESIIMVLCWLWVLPLLVLNLHLPTLWVAIIALLLLLAQVILGFRLALRLPLFARTPLAAAKGGLALIYIPAVVLIVTVLCSSAIGYWLPDTLFKYPQIATPWILLLAPASAVGVFLAGLGGEIAQWLSSFQWVAYFVKWLTTFVDRLQSQVKPPHLRHGPK
jgi:hypothetical protein